MANLIERDASVLSAACMLSAMSSRVHVPVGVMNALQDVVVEQQQQQARLMQQQQQSERNVVYVPSAGVRGVPRTEQYRRSREARKKQITEQLDTAMVSMRILCARRDADANGTHGLAYVAGRTYVEDVSRRVVVRVYASTWTLVDMLPVMPCADYLNLSTEKRYVLHAHFVQMGSKASFHVFGSTLTRIMMRVRFFMASASNKVYTRVLEAAELGAVLGRHDLDGVISDGMVAAHQGQFNKHYTRGMYICLELLPRLMDVEELRLVS